MASLISIIGGAGHKVAAGPTESPDATKGASSAVSPKDTGSIYSKGVDLPT